MLSDYLLHALKYLRLVCTARRLVMPLVAGLCIAGWMMAWYLPNVYQSETRVYVDPQTTIDSALKGLIDQGNNVEQDLVARARVQMVTTANLEKIAIENDMLLDVRTEIDKQIVLEDLANDVWITSQKRQGTRQGTQDIIIAYRDIEAERSRLVVNSFLDVFLNTVLNQSKSDNERTIAFLDTQIEQYAALLDESENKLKTFKIDNKDLMPGEGGGFFEELRKMDEKLKDAQLELRQSRQRRNSLNREYDRLNSTSGASSATALARAERIRELEAHLSDLVLRYTEFHPEVIGTREKLATLKDGFVAPKINRDSVGSQFALAEFAKELSKAETDVAFASAQVDEYSARRAELDNQVAIIPQIEEEFAKLTRNYEADQERYKEFRAKRDKARVNQANDLENGSYEYQVVEEPRTLPRPVEPNRPLLITLIFLGAWAIGVSIPIFLDLVRPSVSSLNDIAKLTEFPVLGTVSMTENSAASMRVGMKTLLVFLILTTIAYAALALLSLLPQNFTFSGIGA